MDYSYIAYTEDKKMVKGKLSSTSEEAAIKLLNYGGYQVVSLKQATNFIDTEKVASYLSKIQPKEIVMFSRQLALLLESGTDIVAAFELLQAQVTNRALKKILGQVANDIRGGSSLSLALSKHPKAFSTMYSRAIAAGEQGGNLEVVLRQMADYMERSIVTEKKIKGALTYPIIVSVVALVVIALLVIFVLPTFTNLYASFNVKLPLPTQILINVAGWASHYGLYVLLGIALAAVAGWLYIRTPTGKYNYHRILLTMPVLGRINQLGELSRCCRTMSLLFKVGLPLPEIMNMAVQGSNNKIVAEALSEVRTDLIRGEGLSKPMTRRPVFLPLMVQMIGVGEETGNLDNTLATVAAAYEAEADDRTSSAVALIQPVMTIVIGVIVAFIALSLVSAMYSMYGQLAGV